MSELPKIRKFKPSDASGITALAMCCFEHSVRRFYTEEGAALFAGCVLPPELLQRQREGALMMVAEARQEIVGCAELRECDHLTMLFVLPEYQGCGLGRQLLERIVKLRNLASPVLRELNVFSTPAAVDFYIHVGFVPTGPEVFTCGVRYTPMKLKLR